MKKTSGLDQMTSEVLFNLICCMMFMKPFYYFMYEKAL